MRSTTAASGLCALLSLAPAPATAQDPAKVAGEVYKCTLENERIRACEVTFAKGAKAIMHTHPDHFAYVVSGGTLRLTSGEGKTQDIEAKTGQMFWLPAQSHAAENIGETTTRFIVVEAQGGGQDVADKIADLATGADLRLRAHEQVTVHTEEPDVVYLRAALARAGRHLDADAVLTEVLAGGRSGQPVFAVKALRDGQLAQSFVLKTISETSARPRALGVGCVEANLWQAGILQGLAAPLSCPAIDLAYNAATRRWWLLMDDVSAGIMGRGIYDADKLGSMMRAMAAMHARYWERADELTGVVASLEATTAKFTQPVLLLARAQPGPDWAQQILDETPLIGAFLPRFLEVLGPRDADFYLDLCQQRSRWLDALNATPKTLTQGDLRRANVAIFPDRVSLFDWDVAAYAPGACDLQWYWFLQFWAYPPSDGRSPEDRAPLLEVYVDALDAALGGDLDRPLFRKSWDLAWVRVFAELGFCLADPLAGEHSAGERARVAEVCKRAVAVTRRACDDHV